MIKLTNKTENLKNLIKAYPDYPIVVIAGEQANPGDYTWMYCSNVTFSVGEILECEAPYNSEIGESDRDDFEQKLEEWLWDEMCDEYSESGMYDDREPTEAEFQKRLKEEIKKYEPYWVKCIQIFADN